MKQANILLKLTKDHEIHLRGVTPIEVLLLVAEHHHNVGGTPIVVDEKSITEVTPVRTTDDELNKLRSKYGRSKVKALVSEIKDLPTDDFKKAESLGLTLSLPKAEKLTQSGT